MPRLLRMLLAALAPLTLLAATSGSSTAQATTGYRILVVGDSISQDLGAAMYSQLHSSPDVTLINDGRPSSGFSNSWFYNWPVKLKAFLAADHPQLVVMLIGANDVRGMTVKGHTLDFNTAPWRAQYKIYVSRVMNEVTSSSAKMLWLGAPVMRTPSYSQGLASINAIYATLAATHSGVTYVPTWNVLTSTPGRFELDARVNGTLAQVRTPDGIHPTPLGASVLATYVIAKIRHLYTAPVHADAPVVITR